MRYINLLDEELKDYYLFLHNQSAEDVVFCPYRIAPLGAHIDHQLGIINGFAIDIGTKIAYRRVLGKMSGFRSLQRKDMTYVDLDGAYFYFHDDWAKYCKAAIYSLSEKYCLNFGITALIDGPIDSAGLSSSASLILAIITAVARANSIELSSAELIKLAYHAESDLLGLHCGKLDYCCEVLSESNKILKFDCLTDSYELIECPDSSDYTFMICYSGIKANLFSSPYVYRQRECKSAAQSLMLHAGLNPSDSLTLRAVPQYVFESCKDRLPDKLYKRALHFYSEMNRAQVGAEVWKSGDLEQYGKLMTASGLSSIVHYECGCEELIRLYHILAHTDGVYGVRFSGAGFRGCCICLIDINKTQSIRQHFMQEYTKQFPKLADKVFSWTCKPSAGLRCKE